MIEFNCKCDKCGKDVQLEDDTFFDVQINVVSIGTRGGLLDNPKHIRSLKRNVCVDCKKDALNTFADYFNIAKSHL